MHRRSQACQQIHSQNANDYANFCALTFNVLVGFGSVIMNGQAQASQCRHCNYEWTRSVGVGREPPILPSPCNAAKPPLVAPLWVAKGEAEGVARWGRALAYWTGTHLPAAKDHPPRSPHQTEYGVRALGPAPTSGYRLMAESAMRSLVN